MKKPISVEQPKCENCKFFQPYSECRRFPPVPLNNGTTSFPMVYAHQWCGEFESIYDEEE